MFIAALFVYSFAALFLILKKKNGKVACKEPTHLNFEQNNKLD